MSLNGRTVKLFPSKLRVHSIPGPNLKSVPRPWLKVGGVTVTFAWSTPDAG